MSEVLVLAPKNADVKIQAFEYFKDCDKVRKRLERMDLADKVYLLAIAESTLQGGYTIRDVLRTIAEIKKEYDVNVSTSNNGDLYRKIRELAERTNFFAYVKAGGRVSLEMDEKLAKYLKKRIKRELKRLSMSIVCSACGNPISAKDDYYIAIKRGHIAGFVHAHCIK